MAAAVSTVSEDSIEFRAFTELYHKLTNGIKSGLIDVCLQAFSKHLFPPEVKSKVLDNASLLSIEQRANIMLEAIHNLIKNCPSTYNEFADILVTIPSMKYLADAMKQKKETLANSMDRRLSSYLIIPNTTSARLDSSTVELDSAAIVVTDLEFSPDPMETVVEERTANKANRSDCVGIASSPRPALPPRPAERANVAGPAQTVPTEDQQRQQSLWEHFIEVIKNLSRCTKVLLLGIFFACLFLIVFGFTAIGFGIEHLNGFVFCNTPVYPGVFSIIFGMLLLFAALTLGLSYTSTTLIIELGWIEDNQEEKLRVPVFCMALGFVSQMFGAILYIIELLYSFALATYVYNFDGYAEQNPDAVCEGSFYGLLYVQLLLIQIPFFVACIIFVIQSIVLVVLAVYRKCKMHIFVW